MRSDSPTDKTELQISEVNGDRICIVLVGRLAHQLERRVGTQPGRDVLPALERDADDLGVKGGRVGDARIPVERVLAALGERPLDERVALVRRLPGRNGAYEQTRECVFEGALGRR
jgi:hypothetical protein